MVENIFASPTKIRPPIHQRTLRNILTFMLVVLLFAVISLPVAVAVRDINDLIEPDQRSCCVPPANFPYALTLVSFPTEDGLTLRGWMIPSQNRAAIMLLHGRGGDRRDGLPLARRLAAEGYGVLLFDMRAHGASTSELFSFGWRDVTAAADFLNGRADIERGKVGAIGFSLGANMALSGAARVNHIAAVISDGAGAATLDDQPPRTEIIDWLMLPGDFAAQLYLQARTGEWSLLSMQDAAAMFAPRPLLLITSNHRDAFGSQYELQVNQRIAAAAPETTELWIVPNVGHVGAYRSDPEAYSTRAVSFMNEALQPADLVPNIR